MNSITTAVAGRAPAQRNSTPPRWSAIYHALDDELDGVVGSLTARAEAQMLRLGVTYALLDGSPTIELAHLDAAEAVWRHCEMTINRLFAAKEADWVLPRLLAGLEEAGPAGLDGSEQRDLFNRHMSGVRLAAARAELHARGLAYTITIDTGGARGSSPVWSGPNLTRSRRHGVWSLSTLPRSPEYDPNPKPILTSDNRCVSEASDE